MEAVGIQALPSVTVGDVLETSVGINSGAQVCKCSVKSSAGRIHSVREERERKAYSKRRREGGRTKNTEQEFDS